jgi:hypothetical protein
VVPITATTALNVFPNVKFQQAGVFKFCYFSSLDPTNWWMLSPAVTVTGAVGTSNTVSFLKFLKVRCFKFFKIFF